MAARYTPTPALKSGLAVEKSKKSFCHEFNFDITIQFSNLYLIL